MTLLVEHGGEQLGPFTPEAAQAALDRGELHPSDRARTEEMSEWMPP